MRGDPLGACAKVNEAAAERVPLKMMALAEMMHKMAANRGRKKVFIYPSRRVGTLKELITNFELDKLSTEDA